MGVKSVFERTYNLIALSFHPSIHASIHPFIYFYRNRIGYSGLLNVYVDVGVLRKKTLATL